MITISELLQSVTTAQVLEKMLAMLEAVGLKARSWREGGALRTILRVIAGIYAGFTALILGFVQAGFLETASGGWLTLLAYHVYGVTRIPATFANGKVTLTSAAGVSYPLAIGALRVTNPTTGKVYTNTESFTIDPGDVLVVAVEAIEQGSASSTGAGTITAFESALPGLTVTNAAAVVGRDEEKDPDLRSRCKAKLGTISGRGPRGAYEFAIRSATRSNGSPVDINRWRVSESSSVGQVDIYVASPTGAPLDTDLPYIVDSIEALARPDTAKVNLYAATPVSYAKTITVWARRTDGISAEDIASTIGTALANALAEYPIGGLAKPPATNKYLFATNVEGIIRAAHPTIYAIDGAGPDQLMTDGQVITLASAIVVNLVDIGTA
jgi:uncharacterized phage protein gp47/JayE